MIYGNVIDTVQDYKTNQFRDIITKILPEIGKILNLDITDFFIKIEDDIEDSFGIYDNSLRTVFINASAMEYISQFIKTLIHEFTHIKQYESGILSSDADGFYWKTDKGYEVFYAYDKFPDLSVEEYNNLPWEIEAIESENIIYKTITNHHHFHNIIDDQKVS